jgi:DNA-binding PadR family transcriptional regulator
MSLKHNLLGALAHRPNTGYSLHKAFVGILQPPFSLQGIYQALNNMADEGLVTYKLVHQKKLPARRVFSVTSHGLTELQRWLSQPLKESTLLTTAFLLHLWFSDLVPEHIPIKNIKRFKQNAIKLLSYYDEHSEKLIKRWSAITGNSEQVYPELTLSLVRTRLAADIDWAEEVIQRFRAKNKAAVNSKSK